MNFLSNSITRRTVIQAIYSNHFVFKPNLDDLINDDEFLSGNIQNQELFVDTMKVVFELWENYIKIFEYLEFEYDIKSTISLSIFKAFIAELFLEKTDHKILMKEYLFLLNSFCPSEAGDVKSFFNKCLEFDFVLKKNEWISQQNSID